MDTHSCEPPLLPVVKRGLAHRTTILTAIGDIRACAVCVSESLFWERLLESSVMPWIVPAAGGMSAFGVLAAGLDKLRSLLELMLRGKPA